MPDFLSVNNACAQTILQLTSKGSAIITEILRLKDHIPKLYKLENKEDAQKYSCVLMDFSYFEVAELQDKKIEASETLKDLDAFVRDNHLALIKRFYSLFESIHSYAANLNHFLDELNDGTYINQTIETVFADIEGKQLLCEALYLYGIMLLMIDEHIDGMVRERLLVSYYRYIPQRRDTRSGIDEVCKLLRDTGYSSNKQSSTYPEEFFKRVPIKSSFVEIVIECLHSDDIYSQLSVYPLAQHRTAALSTQAAMLYICLYFASNILHSQTSIMREIVDRYFPNNWILSIYMGFTHNLIDWWDSFKAAKFALNNTLDSNNIKSYVNKYDSVLPTLIKSTHGLLKEGNLTRENLLYDINKVVGILRDCNITIRWMMLHTTTKLIRPEKNKRCKQIRELITSCTSTETVDVFKLLVNTSQLELLIRESLKDLLAEKINKWEELKVESYNRLIDLAEIFKSSNTVTKSEKNINVQNWFLRISNQIDTLEQDSVKSSRKLARLIQALKEVQEYHQMEANMQVLQNLSETRNCFQQMMQNMDLKEDILVTMQIIGDFNYAWKLIDNYTHIMQSGIKRDPSLVIKLRAVFLKLATGLETPLLRINQAHSDDFLSVSQYYSREVEVYIRKVLQIIPNMMFEKLTNIVHIQTHELKELPTRLEKDKLKEFAQLTERFQIAKLTHSISVYSEGMRMMKNTLVGVINLDPKVLLEDGLRKELIQHISKALHEVLIFNNKQKFIELSSQLNSVFAILSGYKKSFEYIQDYININGLKIWHEEIGRIINYNVEQECNRFCRIKQNRWESMYQSSHVPIPVFPSVDAHSENFIGRLAREILKLTDSRTTFYVDQTSTWYDLKTQKLVFNKESLKLVSSVIEKTGLVGLDQLYCFMIRNTLNIIFGQYKEKIVNDIPDFEKSDDAFQLYQNAIKKNSKVFSSVLDYTLMIGQLQFVRNLISLQLSTSCKFDAKFLESSFQALNKAILHDVKSGNAEGLDENFLYEISQCNDFSGLNDPFNKIYIIIDTPEREIVFQVFVFLVTCLPKIAFYNYDSVRRSSEQIDGIILVVAIHTILRQFHSDANSSFLRLISQYILELTTCQMAKTNQLPSEVVCVLQFLKRYEAYSVSTQYNLKEHLPDEIFHLMDLISVSSG